MNLTVRGHGFNSENITAHVDGVACEVTSYSDFSFSCLVAESSVWDNTTYYQGSNGLRKEVYNHTDWMNWNLLSSYDYYAELALAVESPYYHADKIANKFKGWFIPPKTTNYRFYQACDDYCRLYLGNVSGQVDDPNLMMSSTSWSDYRDYWETRATYFKGENVLISNWTELTEGVPYFFEA